MMDTPWERLRRHMTMSPWSGECGPGAAFHGVPAISTFRLFLHQRRSQGEPRRRFWLHFPVGLHHCVRITTTATR